MKAQVTNYCWISTSTICDDDVRSHLIDIVALLLLIDKKWMVAKKMPNIRVILYMHTKNIFDRRIERTKNLISKYGNCEWSVVTMYYVVFRDEMYT